MASGFLVPLQATVSISQWSLNNQSNSRQLFRQYSSANEQRKHQKGNIVRTTDRNKHASFLGFPVLLSLLIAGITWGGCASTINLPSHWNENKIVVDGKSNEWDVTYLIDDNKLVIGFVNDSNFVYLLLTTNDRPLATSLMRGVTLWFDPQGGTEKTFGIRYPLGGTSPRGARHETGQESDTLVGRAELVGSVPTELEILGPGKDERHKMQVMETGGIQANANLTGNSFVYEIKVPYNEAYPFSIKTKPGSVIGLGLETAQARMSGKGQARGGGGGGMKGGGEGGGMGGGSEGGAAEGGGYGGGGGGMRGGGRGSRGGRGGSGEKSSEATESLDLWIKVPLISKPTN
jgi:hypothetical protein